MGNGLARRRRAGFGLTGLVAGLAAGVMAAGVAWADCAPDAVELRTEAGAIARFSVEIADSEAERAQGLMMRESLARSSGMLFVYETPRHAFFWMKNTLIPLDMIFSDATGRVTVVHENAIPGDTTAIDGGEGVAYVLEINGGLARRLGIAAGTVLRSDLIAQEGAAWRCAVE